MSFIMGVRSGDRVHLQDRMFYVLQEGESTVLIFNTLATACLTEGTPYELADGTIIARENGKRISFTGDMPVLRAEHYIHPHAAATDLQKAWLALQIYHLNGDYSETVHSTLLDTIEDHLGELDETHPGEQKTLDDIFDRAVEGKVVSAISMVRQLIEALEPQRLDAA